MILLFTLIPMYRQLSRITETTTHPTLRRIQYPRKEQPSIVETVQDILQVAPILHQMHRLGH